MKKYNWHFARVLFCISLAATSWADPGDIKIPADKISAYDCGQLVAYRRDSSDGWQFDLQYWSPHLIGDFQQSKLPQAQVKYTIELRPESSDNFHIKVGTCIINQITRFSPKGYIDLPGFKEALKPYHYYTSEVHTGACKTRTINFRRNNPLVSLPAAAFFEFQNTEEGLTTFKQKLSEVILLANRDFSWNGNGTEESPSFNSNGIYEVIGIDNPKDQESTQVMTKLFHKHFGQLYKSTLPKKNKPADQLIQKADESARNIVSTLLQYVETALQSKVSLNQFFMIRPYSDLLGASYRAIPHAVFSAQIPGLAAMAERFTVHASESKIGSEILCRIEIYPNPRGEYGQVRSANVTWQHYEASGANLNEAMVNAYNKYLDEFRNS